MAKKLGEQKLTPKATAQRLTLAVGDFQTPANRLAASLDEFAGNVTGITVRKLQEHATGQEEKGRQAAAEAIAAGHTTLEEMTKAGIIDRGSNPFFRDGVLFMAGQVRANAYNNALVLAAAEEIPSDSTDPNAMDALTERVAQEFTTADDDEATRAGFAERAAGFATAHQQRHTLMVADNLENKHLDQAADLFRGVVLDATDGVDAEFQVANIVMGIQAKAEEWLKTIPDPSRHDLKTMNRGIVQGIASAIEDGSLHEDEAIAAMKLLRGGTGPLWKVKEHAAVIQQALDTMANRETKRVKLRADRELRQKMTREADATEAMFAKAAVTGVLDIQPILDAQIASHGLAFRLGFVESQSELALYYENAAQDTYVGSEAVERDYIGRIFGGENVSREELANRMKTRELTGDQVIMLGNLLSNHQNMLSNNPEKAARFRTMDSAVRGSMTSWMGAEYGSQAYYSAAPAMAQALSGWEADPKNANFTSTSPEFLTFVNDTMKHLQSLYMETDKWQDMQEEQALNEGNNRLELYKTTRFETSPTALKRWLAESQMLEDGHAPSTSFSDFFTVPGRGLSPDAPAGDFSDALYGQLIQSGVDVGSDEFREEIEGLMGEIRGVVVPDETEEEEAGADPIKWDDPSLSKEERSIAFGKMQLKEGRESKVVQELGMALVVRPVSAVYTTLLGALVVMQEDGFEHDWSPEAFQRIAESSGLVGRMAKRKREKEEAAQAARGETPSGDIALNDSGAAD